MLSMFGGGSGSSSTNTGLGDAWVQASRMRSTSRSNSLSNPHPRQLSRQNSGSSVHSVGSMISKGDETLMDEATTDGRNGNSGGNSPSIFMNNLSQLEVSQVNFSLFFHFLIVVLISVL